MPAQLVALDDGVSILLDKPILLLGRHPECDIQIDSRKISRRHCCIAQVNDYLIVRDLGSTNGVRINGVRVLEGKLTEGDEVTIGTSRYQVSWDGDVARAKKPAARQGDPAKEDELLEACDEPVPLPDPDLMLADAPHFGRDLPIAVGKSPNGHAAHGRAEGRPAESILPDDLDLLPMNSNANLIPPAAAPDAPGK
jgi:predicted component of type VI protein secretion system